MGCGDGKKKHQGIDRVVPLVHILHHFLFFHPGPGDALLELARIQTTREATLSATVEGKKITLPLNPNPGKWLQPLLSGTGRLSSPAGDRLGRTEGQKSQICPFTHTPFCRARWMERRQQHPPQTRCYSNCSESGLPYAPKGRRLFAPPWLQETPAKQGSSTKKDPVLS